uniref:FERM domain-containing protein n=1 Tax=Caenorhabditis japonica TaxID=281687 RepID=A0A8R1E644_CAEJA
MTLHLRFRYYPSDPARLSDPNLRYQLFVQLQRDLLHGRLYCPATSAAELAALILQAQLGDYDETKHVGNYVSEYKLLLKQTPKLEERIASIHKELQGKSSVDAELEFLEKASQLDTYAFDPHTIKDPLDPANPVYLGASCKGILIYANQSRTHHIDWNELAKVDYSGRELKLTLSDSYRGGSTTPTNGTNGTLPTSLPNGQVDKVGAAAKQQSVSVFFLLVALCFRSTRDMRTRNSAHLFERDHANTVIFEETQTER